MNPPKVKLTLNVCSLYTHGPVATATRLSKHTRTCLT